MRAAALVILLLTNPVAGCSTSPSLHADAAVPLDASAADGLPEGGLFSDGSSPSGDGGGAGPFVGVCGGSLCVSGQPFRIKGATSYGQLDQFVVEIAAAEQAGLNVLELVEFETKYHDLADTMSEATWSRVDRALAAAAAKGIHLILNLSSYGQSLAAAGQTPTATDWQPYLSFIANRVNTATHVRYADDPTLALIELWGEIPPPNGMGPTGRRSR